MRFLICFLLLSFFLTSCQAAKVPTSDNQDTKNIKINNSGVVKIEKMKDLEKLKKGNIVRLTPAMNKWLNLFSPDIVFTEEDKKALTHWQKRRLIRKLWGVHLKDNPILKIEQDSKTSGLSISFRVHREFKCQVSLPPELEDKLLASSGLKGEVLLEIKPDWNNRCIDALFLESITVYDKDNKKIAKLDISKIKVTPDTRLAFRIYEEGLKIQRQAKKLERQANSLWNEQAEERQALEAEATKLDNESDKLYLRAITNYITAMNCDPDLAPAWNHCAFLLISTKNLKFYKPEKGLKLALTSLASIRKYSNGYLPDVLDSVAWGYFKTGNIKKAVEYQEQAVKHAPKDKGMSSTLKIFKRALAESKPEKNEAGKKKENNVK